MELEFIYYFNFPLNIFKKKKNGKKKKKVALSICEQKA